ncbi:probable pectinesterase/pectinesterase inhibitor 33 [Argentina anserina]|uniref:probable pectinesterase/pectinesterase inhibitor 33 n=1 Tax=Argentina anserina TaxID=57926 RepID=UPI00217677F3|nr:probable pectinesterase/pectinesterase inhibitor 33 [Potentilla anserina]
MGMKLTFLLSLLIFSSLLFQTAQSRSHHHRSNRIRTWCNKTPHPEPCKYCMSHYPHRLTPKHTTDFRRQMVLVALDRALSANSYASQFQQNCESEPQKAAWADCSKLLDNTVHELNRTLEGLDAKHKKSCTNFDAQTWLSAALTNIHTCRDGSKELNVSEFIKPIYTSNNNVSELISNSLAIGSQLLEKENRTATDEGHESYPSWLSNHDRRLLAASSIKASLVVAKDGSGHFRTVQAALNLAAKRKRMTRFIIHVKKGVYRENIEVANTNTNIMLVGDSLRYTIITGSRSVKGGYTTFNSATAGIDGPGFIARGITFSNTAGAAKGQAVALRSSSDLSVFYRCAFQGYQDTLMVHSQRQFYRECYIYGTIDFIFGNAAVVFQNCIVYVRKPIWGQVNVITAQARNDPFQNTAISFHNSQVRAASDLKPVVRYYKTYLGRPWMQYSRVVFMKCYLDSLVDPAGWLEWQRTNFALSTLYYGEYKNFGPASSTRYRVKWPGYHVITSANVANSFTVGSLIAGRSWLPATGVRFTSGL